MEQLIDNQPDVIFLTETWLTSEKNHITAQIKEYGYLPLHKIRKNREKDRGGGIGILVESNISGKQLVSKDYHSFEHNVVKIALNNNNKMTLITVYRLQFVPVAEFIEEFEELLEKYTMHSEDFVIAGDVNLHMETDESPAKKFDEMLERCDLTQNVKGPTHVKGHTIDVVISPNRESYINDIYLRRLDLSHHFLIEFDVKVSASINLTKTITYRPWNKVDHTVLSREIREALLNCPETSNISEKVIAYNTILREKADKFAPRVTKMIRVKQNAPWFDCEYEMMRRKRRKAEKKYRRTGSEEDQNEFKRLRKETTEVAKDKKMNLIRKKIEEGSSKVLYQVVNNLTDNDRERVLPTAKNDEVLANNFLHYFQQKIEQIRSKFTTQREQKKSRVDPNIQQLSSFHPTTEEELRKIVSAHGIKCSPDDPLPAEVLSSNIDALLPYWVEIVNLSLQIGKMDKMKSAVILPLIKELSSMTDTEEYKNYRPVSNLVFIGKLVERVVDIRLQEHIDNNDLNIKEEYGYKQSHSTELLLTWVTDNLLKACDKKMASVVLLLDLSAAFDTVDHEKLLTILEVEIGITGVALKWFREFLTNRTQKVKIGDAYSEIAQLLYGVIQGSILGPRLFNIYIRSVYRSVETTKFEIVGFADDHQLIKKFIIQLKVTSLGEDIRNCLDVIGEWMNEHFLCLNQKKTKNLVVAPPSIKEKIIIGGVHLKESCIRFVDSVKNLGVIIDSLLTFDEQVEKLVKQCFIIIRKLFKVKKYLSQQDLQVVVSARVFSKLDYCNSLYYGLPAYTIKKLQRVQNCCARLVLKKHIPVNTSLDNTFIELHWLPVRFRIIYKVMIIVHNCVYGKAPADIAGMLNKSKSERTLKLQETGSSSRYGDRAFSHVAPKLWNLLPNSIMETVDQMEFKTKLKTFLMIRGDEFIERTKIC